jgi:hypothetical protein
MRILLAVAFLCACCFGGSASASATRPVLRLVSYAPVSVRGVHFEPRERVRVVLSGTQSERHRVRATAAGTFRVSFTSTTDDPCSAAFTIRAVGTRGSFALLKVRPQCPPG